MINYSVQKEFRQYQFEIFFESLFQNTLVSIPTGLGKTFIANNIIKVFRQNFDKKIVFLCPTRPLVQQQYNQYLIFDKQSSTAEISGFTPNREPIYKSHQIFFMTPQCLDNDLTKDIIKMSNFSLIIIDEAHRTTGKYAYNNIISTINNFDNIRIVGLSATPGNSKFQIQEVITNLKTQKLMVKNELMPEIKKYIYNKDISKVVVQYNNFDRQVLTNFETLMNNCLQQINLFYKFDKQYQNLLKEYDSESVIQVIQFVLNNQENIKLKIKDEKFKALNNYLEIFEHLTQGWEMVSSFGVYSLKDWVKQYKTLQKLGYIQIIQQNMANFIQYIQEISSFKQYNNKQQKLVSILEDFFEKKPKSKAIVFTQYKESANIITQILHNSPSILPSLFIGQKNDIGNSIFMTQKQQIKVVKDFQEQEEINVLVATSIGEEGLDIGQVDLIISYDGGYSPIRMIQRMGRTGRSRDGKVIIMLNKGRESQKYEKSQKSNKLINKWLLEQIGENREIELYKNENNLIFEKKYQQEDVILSEGKLEDYYTAPKYIKSIKRKSKIQDSIKIETKNSLNKRKKQSNNNIEKYFNKTQEIHQDQFDISIDNIIEILEQQEKTSKLDDSFELVLNLLNKTPQKSLNIPYSISVNKIQHPQNLIFPVQPIKSIFNF